MHKGNLLALFKKFWYNDDTKQHWQ